MDTPLFLLYGVNFSELVATEYKTILRILIGIEHVLKVTDFSENEC